MTDDLADISRNPQLAALLAAGRRPAEPGELDPAVEAATVAAMAAEVSIARRRTDRGQVARRVLVAKATIGAVVALGVATAAAATGVAVGWVAPDPVERPATTEPPPATGAPTGTGTGSPDAASSSSSSPTTTLGGGSDAVDDVGGQGTGAGKPGNPFPPGRTDQDGDGDEDLDDGTTGQSADDGQGNDGQGNDDRGNDGQGDDATASAPAPPAGRGRPADKGLPPGQAKKQATTTTTTVADNGDGL